MIKFTRDATSFLSYVWLKKLENSKNFPSYTKIRHNFKKMNAKNKRRTILQVLNNLKE